MKTSFWMWLLAPGKHCTFSYMLGNLGVREGENVHSLCTLSFKGKGVNGAKEAKATEALGSSDWRCENSPVIFSEEFSSEGLHFHVNVFSRSPEN